ncbi:MAG: GNAT family N-acetyltransferase [Candidatus Obscuribacterales bacterium]|nr:GNAT family N-acetyltransferase [Candidatus Obscuribacterales bacterium]
MQLQIRRAELSDVEALMPVFNSYRSFYKMQPALDKARVFITENLSNNRSIIFAAVAKQPSGKETIVGFTQLYPRLSSLAMTHYMYLSDLYVDENCRRHGIAKQLMKTAEEYCIANGAIFVELQTAHTNKNAQALYESLGYKTDDEYLTYSLKLPNSIPAIV